MKHAKKIFALALAFVMVMALGVGAFADGPSSGDGTITITNALIGSDYAAYQIFGAQYNETTQSVAYTISKPSDLYDAVSAADDLFTVTAGDTDAFDFVTMKKDADVISWLKADTQQEIIKALTAKAETGADGADANTIEWTVPYGYYFITSSVGTAVTINQNTPDVEIIDKNSSKPSVPEEGLKTITALNGTEASVTTAGVGDVVSFKIEVNTVNYEVKKNEDGEAVSTPITKYTITDNPTGMKIDQDTVAVKVGDIELGKEVVSFDGAGNMTITIHWTEEDGSMKYDAPNVITVTYDAEITSAEKATNSAAAYYNDDQFIGGTDPEDPDDPPTVEVKNYTITIDKYDAADKTKKLEGAEFELYVGDEKVSLVAEQDGTYRVASSEDEETITTIVTNASGAAVIKGLRGNTDYSLVEVKAPTGYNKMVDSQTIELKETDATADVPNSTGATLPSTGGIGTTIFYVVGGVLVAAAVVLLITKKRMSAKG